MMHDVVGTYKEGDPDETLCDCDRSGHFVDRGR